jgi:hypothetical protein
MISKDTRLVTLNSNDAIKSNGSYNSNVFFNIPDIVVDNEGIHHLEVAIIDAQIPFSWFLINNETNTLRYTYNGNTYTITLTNGNYNANTLITQLTEGFLNTSSLVCTIVLSQITGKLTFKFNNPASNIDFLYLGSVGLFRILGFDEQNYSGVAITTPNPLNLLGITKLNICSQNLATISSFSSKKSIGSCIIQTIPVDVPNWNLISYINRNNIHGKMKSRNLNNIDIQILDEFGRFIEFNNIDWNITIQIIIYRNDDVTYSTINSFVDTEKKHLEKINSKNNEKNSKNNEKKSKNLDLEELNLLTEK